MKLSRIKVALPMLAVLAVVFTLYARTIAPPPSPSAVAGAWHGYTPALVEFLRLECDEDGTGYLSVSYLRDTPVRLYRIQSWMLKGWTLDLVAHPLDADSEPIWLRKGKCTYSTIEFEFGGKGWKRAVSLFKEREFESRAAGARERIEGYRKHRK